MLLMAPAASIHAQQDLTREASQLFGTSLRETIKALQEAGVNIDTKEFIKGLEQVIAGQDIMNTSEAEAAVRKALQPPVAPAVPPMDEAAEIAWVESKATLPRAEVLDGGVVLQRLTEGSGAQPGPEATVVVNYTGRLSSGKEFDKTDAPFDIPMQHIIKGLHNAMLQMRQGGTYRVFIPPAMGYGSEAVMDLIPGNSALEFEIEILDIK